MAGWRRSELKAGVYDEIVSARLDRQLRPSALRSRCIAPRSQWASRSAQCSNRCSGMGSPRTGGTEG